MPRQPLPRHPRLHALAEDRLLVLDRGLREVDDSSLAGRRLGERRRRHLLGVTDDDRGPRPAQRTDRVGHPDLRRLVEDDQVELAGRGREEAGHRVRRHQHARHDLRDQLAVLRQQLPDAEPAALLGQLPLQRADLAGAGAPRRTAATAEHRAPAAPRVRCSRTARDGGGEPADRLLVHAARRTGRGPVASSRSGTDAAASPRSNARTASSAAHRAGDQQPAGVEQPGVAQRLEGVEEGDPAAQRHQRRAVDAALGAGHRPAQHEAVVAGPGRRAGRRCCRRPRASRRRRPAAGATASCAAGPGRQPVHDQPAQLDVEERGAVDGGPRAAQPVRPAGRAGRCRGTGSSPRARSGPGSRRRARRSRAPRSAPATAPRPARARPPASPSPRAAGTARAGRGRRSAGGGGPTRTTRRRSARPRRSRPAAGASASRGARRRGPGGGRR